MEATSGHRKMVRPENTGSVGPTNKSSSSSLSRIHRRPNTAVIVKRAT